MSSSFKDKKLSLTEPRPRTFFSRGRQSHPRNESHLFRKFINHYQARQRGRYNQGQDQRPPQQQKNIEGPPQVSIVPPTPWIYLAIVGIIFFLLLVLGFYFYTSNSCIKEYQILQCWKDEMSLTNKCLALEKCMKQQQGQDKVEYLVTFGAACVLIVKKYQREILRLILNIKDKIT